MPKDSRDYSNFNTRYLVAPPPKKLPPMPSITPKNNNSSNSNSSNSNSEKNNGNK